MFLYRLDVEEDLLSEKARDFIHMAKKTSGFIRHMFFLIFTDHEMMSQVVFVCHFLQ
jgi:hypothetical protein